MNPATSSYRSGSAPTQETKVRRRRVSSWLCVTLLVALGQPQTGVAQSQPLQDIATAARQFLAAQSGPQARIDVIELDSRLRLPRCDHALQTFAPPGARPLGNTSVAVRCRSPKTWTLYVQATVKSYEPIVVAKRPLLRGATLRAEDLTLEEREISAPGFANALRDVQNALGQRLKRSLGVGAVVTAQVLAPELLVKRGSQVILRAGAGMFEVNVVGKALSDAAEGDRVRVKNVKSQRIVEGYVMADGSVQVPM